MTAIPFYSTVNKIKSPERQRHTIRACMRKDCCPQHLLMQDRRYSLVSEKGQQRNNDSLEQVERDNAIQDEGFQVHNTPILVGSRLDNALHGLIGSDVELLGKDLHIEGDHHKVVHQRGHNHQRQ